MIGKAKLRISVTPAELQAVIDALRGQELSSYRQGMPEQALLSRELADRLADDKAKPRALRATSL